MSPSDRKEEHDWSAGVHKGQCIIPESSCCPSRTTRISQPRAGWSARSLAVSCPLQLWLFVGRSGNEVRLSAPLRACVSSPQAAAIRTRQSSKARRPERAVLRRSTRMSWSRRTGKALRRLCSSPEETGFRGSTRMSWSGRAGSARPRQGLVACTRPPGSRTRLAAPSQTINPWRHRWSSRDNGRRGRTEPHIPRGGKEDRRQSPTHML
jgi:hypothetical protein